MNVNDKVFVLVEHPGFSSRYIEATVVKVNKVNVKVKFTDNSQLTVNKQYRVKTQDEMNKQNIITSIIHQGI